MRTIYWYAETRKAFCFFFPFLFFLSSEFDGSLYATKIRKEIATHALEVKYILYYTFLFRRDSKANCVQSPAVPVVLP